MLSVINNSVLIQWLICGPTEGKGISKSYNFPISYTNINGYSTLTTPAYSTNSFAYTINAVRNGTTGFKAITNETASSHFFVITIGF